MKVRLSGKMTWIEALPLTLLSIGAMPNKTTGLSPHEILMAQPFPLGIRLNDTSAVDLTQLQELQQNYVKQLFIFVSR